MNKLGLLALTGGSGGSNITLSNVIDQSTTKALTPKAVYDEVATINGKFMKDMTLTGSTKELKLTYNNGSVYTVDLTSFISAIINGLTFGSIITVDAKPTCASGTISYVKGGATLTTSNLHTTFLWEDGGKWKHTMFSSDGDEVTFSTDIDLTGYLTIAQGDSKYVAKNDMSTTIDSSSTNTKVPTAKAVYDFGKDNRIKTYTDISDLKLTYPCTIPDICQKMNGNSVIRFQVGDKTNTITDAPQSYGQLTIEKYTGYCLATFRGNLWSSNADPGYFYVGTMQNNDLSKPVRWKRVATVSMEDVPKTLITITDETYYKNNSGESFYVVKNGVCYVTLVIDCVNPQSNVSIAKLPKPIGIVRFSFPRHSYNAMDGYVLSDGTLKVSAGEAGITYYVCSFSYPVAEN